TILASNVEAITGPVEIRKKGVKAWRTLLISDLVQEGDALRSHGQDGGVTFAKKARVSFDADAVGSVTFTSNGVKIFLESGDLEGESLGYNGLQVENENGALAVWKGGKVRVEALEAGLR